MAKQSPCGRQDRISRNMLVSLARQASQEVPILSRFFALPARSAGSLTEVFPRLPALSGGCSASTFLGRGCPLMDATSGEAQTLLEEPAHGFMPEIMKPKSGNTCSRPQSLPC